MFISLRPIRRLDLPDILLIGPGVSYTKLECFSNHFVMYFSTPIHINMLYSILGQRGEKEALKDRNTIDIL
jgi:hypothetical protein